MTPQTGSADIADPLVERAIARVLSDLLSGPVDVTTPFFRLGATSLTLVRAHRALRAERDPDLAVVDLFARPTVRDLALLITKRRGAAGPPSVETSPAEPVTQVTRTGRRSARALAAELAR